MSGTRWTRVCQAVENFISKLGDGDFIAGLVFNDEIKLLTGESSGNENNKQR